MVYVDNQPATKCRQRLTSIGEGPSVELRPEKFGPYRVARNTPLTVTNDIEKLHDIVLINRVPLPQEAKNIKQDTSERYRDNPSLQGYGSKLKKHHLGKILNEERAK